MRHNANPISRQQNLYYSYKNGNIQDSCSKKVGDNDDTIDLSEED